MTVPGGGSDHAVTNRRAGNGSDGHTGANDPLHPSVPLLVKLGSALVHAEELTEPGAHPFDLEAFKTLASDPEVVAWRKAMDAMALLPVKR